MSLSYVYDVGLGNLIMASSGASKRLLGTVNLSLVDNMACWAIDSRLGAGTPRTQRPRLVRTSPVQASELGGGDFRWPHSEGHTWSSYVGPLIAGMTTTHTHTHIS